MAHSLPTETITLCDAAVLGTAYVRDESLTDTIEISAGASLSLSVPDVYAEDTIGNILDIDLRLSEDSDFTSVVFTSGTSVTDLFIDTIGMDVGNYTLVLESFD